MAIVDRGKTSSGKPPGTQTSSVQASARERSDDERPPDGNPFTQSAKESKESTYGDMIKSPQIQRWIRRIAIAVVIGVLFALVFDIRVGLSIAVLGVIADTVRRSRMNTGGTVWGKRSVAQRRTEKQLRGMTKAGYHTLHARAVPRDSEGVSDGRIDHLVIGPTGVYAIDSEKWDKRLPVRALSHRKLFLGPFNKKERLDEARWESDQASRILSKEMGYEVPVQPSLAIYGPAISWKVLMVRDVDVYSGGRARNYLRRRPKILTPIDVERIHKAAERALPSKYGDD
jgi:Nuclease-related domain